MPEITIIFCGRNDNINGDFSRRAILAQAHNVTLLTKAQVSFEHIYVEWNPIPSNPYFSEQLLQINPALKTFIVPPELHRHYCDNMHVNVLQFFAKNVGARRASSENILITNGDTYLSSHVIKRLKSGVKNNTLYLYERHDINPELLNEDNVSTQQLCDPNNLVAINKINPPLDFGAAGDLMLLKKEFFKKIGGYNETIRFSSIHVDTLFCRNAELLGGKIINDGVIYHLDHTDSFRNTNAMERNHNGILYEWARTPLPYTNLSTWGLKGVKGIDKHNGHTILKMPLGILRAEQPEKPIIPALYQADREFISVFNNALSFLAESQVPVMLYGFGAELRAAYNTGSLKKLNIIGCIDDNCKEITGVNFPIYSFLDASLVKFETVLIGSAYWSQQLTSKAIKEWGTGRVLPMQKGSSIQNYFREKEIHYIEGHLQAVWKLIHKLHPKKSLYGAGKHTFWLLQYLIRYKLPLPDLILDDYSQEHKIFGVPIARPGSVNKEEICAVILSTDQPNHSMLKRTKELWGNSLEIYELYEKMAITPFEKKAN